jgi:hypothetical protein
MGRNSEAMTGSLITLLVASSLKLKVAYKFRDDSVQRLLVLQDRPYEGLHDVFFTILNFLQGFRERKEVFPLTVMRKQIRIRVF